jgi:two-component system chemotaxis response regulator CheY
LCLSRKTNGTMKWKINNKHPRFILLDDDLLALMLAEKIIQKYYRRSQIMTFSTAKEAIEYVEAKDSIGNDRDTVFLTDLHMPEMDGFEVLDRMENTVKTKGCRLHIFVLSAATPPDDIRRVLSYNYVIGFLDKPFSDEKMEHIISCIQYPL